VGRPALDTDRVEDPEALAADRAAADGRRTVLYAPTWEGGQASVAYSSLVTHAPVLVRSLQEAGLRVIYRPHPLTGVRLPEYGAADAEVRELLSRGGHLVSSGRSLQRDFAAADLLVCDVSAVANDWLAGGRPMIITSVAHPGAQDAGTELLRRVPRLRSQDSPGAGALALREIEEDPSAADRDRLREYYLGDTTPGASLDRFLDACRDLMALRDRQWKRIRLAEHPQGTEADRR
jgi:CDP-glycerol glycerophosphotransferase (TagB/SpsB family)